MNEEIITLYTFRVKYTLRLAPGKFSEESRTIITKDRLGRDVGNMFYYGDARQAMGIQILSIEFIGEVENADKDGKLEFLEP